jgi:hypothetical protein
MNDADGAGRSGPAIGLGGDAGGEVGSEKGMKSCSALLTKVT